MAPFSRTARIGLGSLAVVLMVALGGVVASVSTGAAPKTSVVTISYRDNGGTVHLAVGQTLRVVLNSTYWSVGSNSARGILASKGAPTVVPRSGCVPGEGCGTVTALFTAAGRGTTSVTASRVSCGEAMRCTGGNGTFSVTVLVD